MTTKQENILEAALQLFATEGFHATSTSKVAKAAGVSEGLIFRHFGNKDGLLQAVISQGEASFTTLFAGVVMETDPKTMIRKALSIPFEVPESEYTFWKLQFSLKWELGYNATAKMEPLTVALTHAFTKLGYAKPALEAELLLHLLEGVGSAILKGALTDRAAIKQLMLERYEV